MMWVFRDSIRIRWRFGQIITFIPWERRSGIRWEKRPDSPARSGRKKNTTRCQARCIPDVGRSCLAPRILLWVVTQAFEGVHLSPRYGSKRQSLRCLTRASLIGTHRVRHRAHSGAGAAPPADGERSHGGVPD